MVRHNNEISNNHFHKDWQRFVRLHFDQPMQKIRRRNLRVKKANRSAPRPIRKLRPLTHCPTIRYNTKMRLGRGFNYQELRAVNLHPNYAMTIGISVDKRRRYSANIEANVRRLKKYLSKLIVLPDGRAEKEQLARTAEDIFPKRRASVPKAMDLEKAKLLAYETKQVRLDIKKEKKRKAKKNKIEDNII
ncbi:PREDICTED: 60S ribosomal protein L13-like [Nicrophorus vespilloides]|uniref:Large ribosomal subunit protein eL13 n=1 Tax=Nicrophorus vespilloides TaxID=110193 RepID=A0ABM1M472_NICVS|nr:PREDICTED: 60S ribosomal protein L13-like [Nicrophorus vespilloides]